jgi:hypothetical protein
MPHLGECWWGQLFTDVIFANIPSFYIGIYILHFLKIEEYDILGRKGKKSFFQWKV